MMRLAPLLALAGLVGCARVLMPPPAPPRQSPDLSAEPPVPEGAGRLYVDVVDGPTPVRSVERSSLRLQIGGGTLLAHRRRTEQLCVTPCLVDLPYGRYELAFPSRGSGRLETDEINVGPSPMVYRRALGLHDPPGAGHALGIVSTVFGAIAMVIGTVFLPVGLGTDSDSMARAGGITLGVGGALVALGIVGVALSPTVSQRGAAVYFPAQ